MLNKYKYSLFGVALAMILGFTECLPPIPVEPTPPPKPAGKQVLVDSLKDLRDAMTEKIGFDVDYTAFAFGSVKDYRRTKRWADIAKVPLRVLEDTLLLPSKKSELEDLRNEVDKTMREAKTVYQILSIYLMVQGLQEAGEKLFYGLYGPIYVSAIERMLDEADATTVPPFDFNKEYYEKVIKNHLHGVQGEPVVIVARRSTGADRKVVGSVNGALQVRTSITKTFNELIADIEARDLPEGFPVDEVITQLEYLKEKVIESRLHSVEILYKTSISVQEMITIGTVADRRNVWRMAIDNLIKKLDIEIKVESSQAVSTMFCVMTYKYPSVDALKIVQQATGTRALLLRSEIMRVFHSDPEEQFYMLPQEMLLTLPIEFSNLWMIADDIDLYLRHLLGEKIAPVPTATQSRRFTPSPAPITNTPTRLPTATPTAPQPLATISAASVNRLALLTRLNLKGSMAKGSMASIAFSPDGQTLASLSWSADKNFLQFWKVSDGTLLQTSEFLNPTWAVSAFSLDLQFLALGPAEIVKVSDLDYEYKACLYETKTLKKVRCFKMDSTETEGVLSMGFSPNGQILTLNSLIKTENVWLWQVSDGALLRVLKDPRGNMAESIGFSPNGQLIATGGGRMFSRLPGIVRFWQVSNGTLIRSIQTSGNVTSLTFSPDGKLLATGTGFRGGYPLEDEVEDDDVAVWRVSDGKLLHTLKGQKGPIEKIAFSPDGAILASAGSGDKTVRLWQVSDGKLLRTLKPGITVAFSPDGRILAVVSSNEIQLWGVSGTPISTPSPTLGAPPPPQPPVRRARTPTPVPKTDKEAIKQLIVAEGEAVIQQDIDRLQGIWASDGIMTDASHTPNNPSDDVSWKGWLAIRNRYVDIFLFFSPTFVESPNVRITVMGDTATAISDSKIGITNLTDNVRWTFRKIEGRWKISSLTFGLTPK